MDELPDEATEIVETNKIGRPLIKIEWHDVDVMLKLQATGEEICAHIGCSYDTLERACKRENEKSFAEYSREKRMQGNLSLRRAQMKEALDGNTAMLIFLGKNYLNQRDKLDHALIEQKADESTPEGMDDWYGDPEVELEMTRVAEDKMIEFGIAVDGMNEDDDEFADVAAG